MIHRVVMRSRVGRAVAAFARMRATWPALWRMRLPRLALLGGQLERLRRTQARLDETLKELHVQGRRRLRLRMPLDADTEPARVGRLDRLDDAVRRRGADTQAGAGLSDRLVVRAVDAQLAAAVDLIEACVGHQQH